MREMLFRGKEKHTQNWVYGFLTKWGDDFIIDYLDEADGLWTISQPIIPETIGQYTGCCDKNGNKIFEGDIVCIRYQSGKICYIYDIQLDCDIFGAERTHHKNTKSLVVGFGQLHNLQRLDDDVITMIEVIGNIHDNLELLED